MSIVLVSLSMSGDNALVIGMAVHTLPDDKRRLATALAIFGAIAFRVVFAGLFAFLLYRTELIAVRLVGGLLLVYIAYSLLTEDFDTDEDGHGDTNTLLEALAIILIADASMSLDNMLAVAAASEGEIWLIGFGLLITIPLLFVGATAISTALDKVPQLLWFGGAIIAYVSGELITEEPLLVHAFHYPHQLTAHVTTPEVGGVLVLLLVVTAGYLENRGDDAVVGNVE
ncbi:MAG: YjbE family putative metal transport protein [Haloferacaceae archaeon]